MSEEIRKTGMEINDADLEGVSGGRSEEALAEAMRIHDESSRMQADSSSGEQEAGPGNPQSRHYIPRGRLS